MNTCANCKHFGKPDPISRYEEGIGGEIESEHHLCLRVLHGNGDRNDIKAAMSEPAVVCDGSGYQASLRVLPTFGCVLWEVRS